MEKPTSLEELQKAVDDRLTAELGHHDEFRLHEHQSQILDYINLLNNPLVVNAKHVPHNMGKTIVCSTASGADGFLQRFREESAKHKLAVLPLLHMKGKHSPEDVFQIAHTPLDQNIRFKSMKTRPDQGDIVFDLEGPFMLFDSMRDHFMLHEMDEALTLRHPFKFGEDIAALRTIYLLNMGGSGKIEERHEKACKKILGSRKKRRKAIRKILDGFYLEVRESERVEQGSTVQAQPASAVPRVDATAGIDSHGEGEPRGSY